MHIIELDVQRVRSTLSETAQRLRRDPNVLQVMLFGSLARGDYTGGSDADVLIVLKRDERARWFDRIPEYLRHFSDVPIPVEVFPYTQEEVDRALGHGNLFFEEMLREGIRIGEESERHPKEKGKRQGFP